MGSSGPCFDQSERDPEFTITGTNTWKFCDRKRNCFCHLVVLCVPAELVVRSHQVVTPWCLLASELIDSCCDRYCSLDIFSLGMAAMRLASSGGHV
ncbi:hypothetical protein ACOMHN_050481 [Nucella lapillus]